MYAHYMCMHEGYYINWGLFMKRIFIIFLVFIIIFLFSTDIFALTVNVPESKTSYVFNSGLTYEGEYNEELGWNCKYDIYTYLGYFSGNFYLPNDMLSNKKYVTVFNPTNEEIYIYYTSNTNINTFYFQRIRNYRFCLFYY